MYAFKKFFLFSSEIKKNKYKIYFKEKYFVFVCSKFLYCLYQIFALQINI